MATIDGSSVKKLIVACDAGMGSSVMLASTLKKQLAKSGVTVEHSPVSSIPSDADVVVTQAGLANRARGVVPDVPVIPFQLFLGDPAIAKLVKAILDGASDINPYGSTNEAEFLSVVSEYFFQQPHLLEKQHPELYVLLEKIFRQELS